MIFREIERFDDFEHSQVLDGYSRLRSVDWAAGHKGLIGAWVQFDPHGSSSKPRDCTETASRAETSRYYVLPIRMCSSTQFRYNRGAQMTQQPSRFLDKKGGVCAVAARHRPSARPTRRRLATRIVLASTHHTCGCIPRTHTQFRMSRPPSRACIRAAETFAGFSWPRACTGTQIVTVFTGK